MASRSRNLVLRVAFGSALMVSALSTMPASAEAPLKVSIGFASSSLPASAARIAQQLGLFEKNGLEAKLTLMDSANVASMALISGSVDFSVTAASEVILAQARGQKLLVVSNMYSGYSPVLVVAKALAERSKLPSEADVEARLKALDGATIASVSATSNYTLGLKCAADMVGVKIRFTYMAQPAMVAALETGAVEGIVAGSPYYAAPVRKGTGLSWISGPRGEYPEKCSLRSAATLNTTQTYAETHKEEIRRVRAALLDLGNAVKERPAEVKAAVAQLFPTVDPPTLELLFEAEGANFNTDALKPADLAKEIAFVKASGANVPGLEKIDPAVLILP